MATIVTLIASERRFSPIKRDQTGPGRNKLGCQASGFGEDLKRCFFCLIVGEDSLKYLKLNS